MAKQRTGYVFKDDKGDWWARLTFRDQSGKRRNLKRRVRTKTEGREVLKELLREFEDHGEQTVLSSRMTFEELAQHYESTYLIEAQYLDDRKVAGLRSCYTQKLVLRTLREHFGARILRSITAGDLDKFKSVRLATPKRPRKEGQEPGGQRAIASVNRELALLRRLLNVAQEEGWILKNPFRSRRAIISIADERKRERILTRDEEARLIAACSGRCMHLKAILICALDTGMRRGEILKLKWSDVDFVGATIRVRAFNTKTMQERNVAMTQRLKKALEAVYELSTKEPNALCFGIEDNVKKCFNTVRKAAGLSDVRFHDLRHTVATKLVSAHMPLHEVGRILGHTKPQTTYRYVNANIETARRAAAALDEFNRSLNDIRPPSGD